MARGLPMMICSTKHAIDPIMGGTAMRGNFVKIVKGA